MAHIIKSSMPSNLMKLVDVKQYIGYFERNETFDYNGITCRAPDTDHYWWIETPITGTPLDTFMGETRRAYIPDLWLKPIPKDLLDGDPDEETLDLGQDRTVEA